MQIHELLDVWALNDMLSEGLVRFQTHPSFPELRIFNYTEKAAYNREWNDVTLKCRGLIVNWNTKEVLARPFDKFFNYGESSAPVFDLDSDLDDITVTDKMDGSLGILYRLPNGTYAIATRGSFASDQAIHATELFKKKYWTTHFNGDLTYMFEIIYPNNRIVLDYGTRDELVLLGARDIETGAEYGPNELFDWHGPKTRTFHYKTLREALEAPPRPNAEGYVVYSSMLDTRIKIKQDDYVALHKIVTGLTKRRVWQNLGEGQSLEAMLDIVPDEWHDWLGYTVHELLINQMKLRVSTMHDFYEVMSKMPDTFNKVTDRKLFAMEALKYKNSGWLFMILDGGNLSEVTWKAIKPSNEDM